MTFVFLTTLRGTTTMSIMCECLWSVRNGLLVSIVILIIKSDNMLFLSHVGFDRLMAAATPPRTHSGLDVFLPSDLYRYSTTRARKHIGACFQSICSLTFTHGWRPCAGHLLSSFLVLCFAVTKFGHTRPQLSELRIASSRLWHGPTKQQERRSLWWTLLY